MHELNFRITNLNCDACVKMTTSTLRRLSAGTMDVTVDVVTGQTRVASEELLTPDAVAAALNAKGYQTAF